MLGSAGACQTSGFDGTWIYDKGRSGPHRELTETVTLAHTGAGIAYSALVVVDGKQSGVRFEAPFDDKPHPLLEIMSGNPIGTVTARSRGPQIEDIRFDFNGDKRPPIIIEHWLSNDGSALMALLKTPDGTVDSILTFLRSSDSAK
jgi:hypothetical protein